MTSLDLDAIQTDLERQQARLVAQLSELGATRSGDLQDDLNADEGFADAAATTAERTERIGVVEALKGQLDEVDKALERIEDGSYGICSNCGNPIAPERLEARPESTLCVTCKSRGI